MTGQSDTPAPLPGTEACRGCGQPRHPLVGKVHCPVCGTVRWTLAITGSRLLTCKRDLVLAAARDGLLQLRERMGGWPARVLHGDAPGIDRILAARLHQAGWPVTAVPADWERNGRRAGVLRDLSLIARADALLAIWDATSPGTKHTLKLAAERDLTVVSHLLGDQRQPDLQPLRPHPQPPVMPDSSPEPKVGQDILPLSQGLG